MRLRANQYDISPSSAGRRVNASAGCYKGLDYADVRMSAGKPIPGGSRLHSLRSGSSDRVRLYASIVRFGDMAISPVVPPLTMW
jgi:hypothetical protein